MPVLDMPLEELRTYKGTNPCPKDFSTFWEESLKEMKSVQSNMELIPSDFQVPFAECYNLYFTGVRNARIHAQFIKPKNIQGKCPALILFHGYNWSQGDWSEKLHYVAAGFVVVALSCRGQSGSEDTGGVKGLTSPGLFIRGVDDEPKNMTMRHTMLDTAQLASLIMELDYVDETKISTYGASQGGGLSLACAALEPRIHKAVSIYPFLSDYQRVWEMDLAKNAYDEITHYFRVFDPEHQREKEVFTKLGYIDIKNMAEWIQAEVLMATGLQDAICPPSTQFAVFNKIQSKKTQILYPDFQHEWIPRFADRSYLFITGFTKA